MDDLQYKKIMGKFTLIESMIQNVPGHFLVLLFLIILLGRTCDLEEQLDRIERRLNAKSK